MSDFTITIKPSFAEVGRALGNVKFESFLRKEINKVAFSIERVAKQVTPVDTGTLKSSILTSPAVLGLKATISPRVHYAIYVHEGTRYMRARPFMTMGAAFVSVTEFQGINVRLDQEFTKEFKKVKRV